MKIFAWNIKKCMEGIKTYVTERGCPSSLTFLGRNIFLRDLTTEHPQSTLSP
jgi:hypothetical protein